MGISYDARVTEYAYLYNISVKCWIPQNDGDYRVDVDFSYELKDSSEKLLGMFVETKNLIAAQAGKPTSAEILSALSTATPATFQGYVDAVKSSKAGFPS